MGLSRSNVAQLAIVQLTIGWLMVAFSSSPYDRNLRALRIIWSLIGWVVPASFIPSALRHPNQIASAVGSVMLFALSTAIVFTPAIFSERVFCATAFIMILIHVCTLVITMALFRPVDDRILPTRYDIESPPVATIPVATIPVATIPVATIPVATIPVATIPVATIPVATIPVATIPVATIPVERSVSQPAESTIDTARNYLTIFRSNSEAPPMRHSSSHHSYSDDDVASPSFSDNMITEIISPSNNSTSVEEDPSNSPISNKYPNHQTESISPAPTWELVQ